MFIITAWINGIKTILRLTYFSIVQFLFSIPIFIGVYATMLINYDGKTHLTDKDDPTVFWYCMLAYLILLPFTYSATARVTGYVRGNDD